VSKSSWTGRLITGTWLAMVVAVATGSFVPAPALAAPVGVPVAGVQGTVVAWGDDSHGQASVPAGLTGVTAVAASELGSLLLHADGTVSQFGRQSVAVPPGLTDVTAITAGAYFNLALRADGTVVAWGSGPGVTDLPAGLTDVTAIAAGGEHGVALLDDGTVRTWGREDHWSAPYPQPPSGLSDVTAITSGYDVSYALKSDGTVVSWPYQYTPAGGLSGVTVVSSGLLHALALRSDGSIVGWGQNHDGAIDVPAGLTGVTALAAGGGSSYALRADGTVAAWGWNQSGKTTVPAGLTNVRAIAAGYGHVLALVQQPSTDSQLSGLGISAGTLSPAFGAATTSYTAGVANTVTSLTVTPTTSNGNATVSVNGTAVTSGNASGAIALDVGTTTITMVVVAQDGSTATTYTLTVTRAGLAPSFTDATIGALRVGVSTADGVRAAGSPVITYAVTAGALPAGLSLDPTSGAITGTPTSAGAFAATVSATNPHGTDTARLTGSVQAAAGAVVRVTGRPESGAAAAGAVVGFSGAGLTPGSAVTVTLYSEPVLLYSGTVGADGLSTPTVALPADIPAGAHRVEYVATAPDGTVTTSVLWFTVLPDGTIGTVSLIGPLAYDPQTAAATSGVALAHTGPGVDLLLLTGLASLALLIGIALTVSSRRQTR
jgi:hypothetical protein